MHPASLLFASLAVSQMVPTVPVAYAQTAYDYDSESQSPAQWVAKSLGSSLGMAEACGEDVSDLQTKSIQFIQANSTDKNDMKLAYSQLAAGREEAFNNQQDPSTAYSCTEARHQVDMAFRTIDYTQQVIDSNEPKAKPTSPLSYVAQLGDKALDAYKNGYEVEASGDLDGQNEVTLKLVPTKSEDPDTPVSIAPNSKRKILNSGLPTPGTGTQPSYVTTPVTSATASGQIQLDGQLPGVAPPPTLDKPALPNAFSNNGKGAAKNDYCPDCGFSGKSLPKAESSKKTQINPYTGQAVPTTGSSGSKKSTSYFNSIYQ